MKVGGQLHAPAALPPGKRPSTQYIGGWVYPRAGLDGCEKSRPHRYIFTSCIYNQHMHYSFVVIYTPTYVSTTY
jgi:hypothetical protein